MKKFRIALITVSALAMTAAVVFAASPPQAQTGQGATISALARADGYASGRDRGAAVSAAAKTYGAKVSTEAKANGAAAAAAGKAKGAAAAAAGKAKGAAAAAAAAHLRDGRSRRPGNRCRRRCRRPGNRSCRRSRRSGASPVARAASSYGRRPSSRKVFFHLTLRRVGHRPCHCAHARPASGQ